MAIIAAPESELLEDMDRHVPVHPLPDEIQKMPREETVCQYCGVSYLILHEFQLLEEKMKAMEKEMKFYQGSVEREKRLQEELLRLSREHEHNKTGSESKTERLQILALQLKGKEDELQTLSEELTNCQQQVKVACGQRELLGKKAAKQHTSLMKTLSLLTFLQSEQTAIKKDINAILGNWTALKREISSQVEETSKAFSADITSLNEHLAASQAETASLQKQVKSLQVVSDSVVLTSQQLQASLQTEKELNNRCHELKKQTLDLQKQLETVGLNFQDVAKEMEHHKEIAIIKTKEATDYQTKLRRIEYDKESTEIRLIKELREKEDSLAHFQEKSKQLQEEIAEKERREENSRRRTQSSENELETMKEVLKQTEEEVVTLKHERELTIVSYQNRIEQLQENLRHRMLSDDSWTRKLEAGVDNERQKYLLKLEETELKFKEKAKMELDIEKQKHDEVIKKFRKEQEELEMKVPVLISSACDELHTEINILERKLVETQTRLREKDTLKESEIGNLKKMVSKLELCLKREEDNNSSVLGEMRKEVYAKSEDLKESTQNIKELRQHLDQIKQENSFLQETVRLECEERYELTEALTRAREQLLELKRVNGSFPSSERSFNPDRPVPPHAITHTGQKNMMNLSSSRGTELISLHGNFGSGVAPKHRKSSSINLPKLPSPHPPKDRASSVTDARQKITAILRRNSTQP
ncbi:protein LEKR1 isoform X3 [Ascaphus truei]